MDARDKRGHDESEFATGATMRRNSRPQVRRKQRKQFIPPRWRWRVMTHSPGFRSPGFRSLAHRASLAIARSPHEADDQAFIDSISWWNSDEAKALAASDGYSLLSRAETITARSA